jgi:hypothetical protein
MDQILLFQNQETVEIGLLAAKISCLNNDTAKLTINGMSLVHHAIQLGKMCSLRNEYIQTLNLVNLKMTMYGRTKLLCELERQCHLGIESCRNKIIGYGIAIPFEMASIGSSIYRLSQKNK